MEITRIKPTKYRVGRYILNHLEVLQLTLEVKMGLKPVGIKVTNLDTNVTGHIQLDGSWDNNVLSTKSQELLLELIRYNKESL